MPIRRLSYIWHTMNDVEFPQRIVDGYFDATAMCKAADKDIEDYLDLRKTELFLQALSEETGTDKSELLQYKKGAKFTWVHPLVAINLAQWANPRLAVMVPIAVFDWMNRQTHEETEEVSHEFDDVDPEFTSWIKKAVEFDHRKSKK